jgi:hypothetical protein
MEAINLNEEAAVADVKAQVAAQAKAVTERAMAPVVRPRCDASPISMSVPITPNTLGLPAPPPPPASSGALPPDWQEASGPTGVYYYNTRTNETSWTRPQGAPPSAGVPYGAGVMSASGKGGASRAPNVPKKLGITARMGWGR